MLFGVVSYAQTATGTITDQSDQPLSGATVIAGTSTGVADFDVKLKLLLNKILLSQLKLVVLVFYLVQLRLVVFNN